MRLWHWCISLLLVLPAAAQVPVTRVAPFNAPGLSTNVVTFVNASDSPTGATTATGQNVAGAGDSTIGNVPGISAASISVPVYVHAPTTELIPSAETQAAAATTQAGGGFVDVLGAMQTDSVYAAIPPADTISVAEASRQAKQRDAALRNVRSFTNADVQQLANNSGATQPAGAALATTPSSGGTSGTAVQSPSPSPSAQPATSAEPSGPPAQQQNPPSSNAQTTTTAPSPALPATASLLPLLAIGAALAGGLGLVLRHLA